MHWLPKSLPSISTCSMKIRQLVRQTNDTATSANRNTACQRRRQLQKWFVHTKQVQEILNIHTDSPFAQFFNPLDDMRLHVLISTTSCRCLGIKKEKWQQCLCRRHWIFVTGISSQSEINTRIDRRPQATTNDCISKAFAPLVQVCAVHLSLQIGHSSTWEVQSTTVWPSSSVNTWQLLDKKCHPRCLMWG